MQRLVTSALHAKTTAIVSAVTKINADMDAANRPGATSDQRHTASAGVVVQLVSMAGTCLSLGLSASTGPA